MRLTTFVGSERKRARILVAMAVVLVVMGLALGDVHAWTPAGLFFVLAAVFLELARRMFRHCHVLDVSATALRDRGKSISIWL